MEFQAQITTPAGGPGRASGGDRPQHAQQQDARKRPEATRVPSKKMKLGELRRVRLGGVVAGTDPSKMSNYLLRKLSLIYMIDYIV